MFIKFLNSMLIMNFIYLMILIIMNLISVAFLTLFERKVLGYIQFRKGPNKAGLMGLLQPFSDVIKLLTKEMFILKNTNILLYSLMPILMLVLSMTMWILVPQNNNLYCLKNGILLMLTIMGLNIYPVILMGWSSNSNYSLLGSVRSIAQSLSYEVLLFLMLFIFMLLVESYSLNNFFIYQYYMKFFFIMLPVYMIFMVSMLIELNRTPFDLVEGESELVSGFNVEYYGSFFSFIFMSEYLSIIFVSYLVMILFFGTNMDKWWSFMVYLFHMIMIIWLRGVLPRMRYDEMMMMCWKSFLSIIILYLFMIFGIKEIIKMTIWF